MAASIHPEQQLKVFTKLRKIAEKMLQKDDKYRILYVNNPQLQKSLLVFDGGLEFLYNLGYAPTRENKQKLVCEYPNARVINACLLCLTDKIDSLRNEPTPVPPRFTSAATSYTPDKHSNLEDSPDAALDVAKLPFLPDDQDDEGLSNGNKSKDKLTHTNKRLATESKTTHKSNGEAGGNGYQASSSIAIANRNGKASNVPVHQSASMPQFFHAPVHLQSQNKIPRHFFRRVCFLFFFFFPSIFLMCMYNVGTLRTRNNNNDNNNNNNKSEITTKSSLIQNHNESQRKHVLWKVIILIRHGNSYWNSQKNDGSSLKKWTAVGRGLIEMIGGSKSHTDSVVVDAPLSKNGIDEAFGLSKFLSRHVYARRFQHNQFLTKLQKLSSPVKDSVRLMQTQFFDDVRYKFSL
ncbi:hypothetical protein RFI_13419, partial [Reticulomyxa filosa]